MPLRETSLPVRIGLAVVGLSLPLLGCNNDVPTIQQKNIERLGSISVGSSSNAAWTPKPLGLFYRRSAQSADDDCQVSIDNGICRVWSCSETVYQTGSVLTTVSAGRVKVTTATQALELELGEDGYYRQPNAPTALWNEGDTLTFSVEGSADFPAITARLPAPPTLTVSTPVVSEQPLALDKSASFPLVWAGPQTGSVFVAVSPETVAADGAEPQVTPGIDCEFPAKAGGGSIPSAFLTLLPAPATLTKYYLDVLTYSYNYAVVDDAWLDMRANWVGLSTPAALTTTAE